MQNKITLDEATHTYRLNDRIIPSVTQVLGLLDTSYEFVEPILLAKAAEFGTEVHKACEAYDNKETVVTNNRLVDVYLDNYIKFLNENDVHVVLNEHLVYSEIYQYAGTLDRVFRINNKNWLCDIKTSKNYSKTMGLQLNAYAQAINEQSPGFIDGAFILKLSDNKYERKQYDITPESINVFLSALNVHNWRTMNT